MPYDMYKTDLIIIYFISLIDYKNYYSFNYPKMTLFSLALYKGVKAIGRLDSFALSNNQKQLRIMLNQNQEYIVLKGWVHLILCNGVKLALELGNLGSNPR